MDGQEHIEGSQKLNLNTIELIMINAVLFANPMGIDCLNSIMMLCYANNHCAFARNCTYFEIFGNACMHIYSRKGVSLFLRSQGPRDDTSLMSRHTTL